MQLVIRRTVSLRRAQLAKAVKKVMQLTVSPEDGGPALLPDGSHAAICSNGAMYLQSRVGGVVYGYLHEDNPTARLGYGKDGHDFLMVEGRYIVDLWACDYEGVLSDGVVDLEDPAEAALVAELYGDARRWQLVQARPSALETPGHAGVALLDTPFH